MSKAVSHSKPCSVCSTPRDVLVRCQIDDTGKWHFLCPGKCWKDASGNNIDGDASHPYYRYGGMWKNKHEAVSAKKKKKGKEKKQEKLSEWTAEDVDTPMSRAADAGHSTDGEDELATGTDGSASDAEAPDSPENERRFSSKKYTRNDRVTYKGRIYVCRKSHWAEESKSPDEDIHSWEDKGPQEVEA